MFTLPSESFSTTILIISRHFYYAQECTKVTSECPEVASELVRDIFEFFGLFFQGKDIIMRKHYF